MRHIDISVPTGYRLHVGETAYDGPKRVTVDVPADTPERLERIAPPPLPPTAEQLAKAAAAAALARPCTMADLYAAVPAALERAPQGVRDLHAARQQMAADASAAKRVGG